MKKNFFMLAATAALFAACAETELVNEVNVEGTQQEIGFSTFAGKTTRAENSTQTEKLGLEQHHGDFDVWAYKNTMNPAYVFEDVEVTYVTADDKWEYTPLKYWDKAANDYEFYAAAPSRADWKLIRGTAAQNDDYFKLVNFVLEDKSIESTEYTQSFKGTNTQDLMIASPENVGEAAILAAQKVNLEFNHILSRLNVTVKKSEVLKNETVVLTAISVKNLPNSGSFDESKVAISAASSTERWDVFSAYKGQITGIGLASVETKASYVIQSLIMPQNVEYQAIDRDGSNNSTTVAPYLELAYTIGGEPFNASYNLANTFGSEADPVPFNEGWQNTLNITIDASVIEFEAETYKWVVYDKKNPTFGNENF